MATPKYVFVKTYLNNCRKSSYLVALIFFPQNVILTGGNSEQATFSLGQALYSLTEVITMYAAILFYVQQDELTPFVSFWKPSFE